MNVNMKKKQITGLIAAGLVFVFVCVASAATNIVMDVVNESMAEVFKSTYSESLPFSPYIGVVAIKGTILDAESSGLFSQTAYMHNETLKYIEEMMNSTYNKGILLTLNTPGGSVYATDEVYLKLMEYKEKTGRPIWAYMEDMACSGGYYLAMAADAVYGNRNGWTGSIGVIISASNMKGLYDKLGIEEINITSGINKSMGSSGTEMSEEQRAIYQSLVDEAYEQFVDVVEEGRGMDEAAVKKLADGRIYSMQQAMDAGLVDGVVTYDEMLSQIRNEVGAGVDIYERTRESDFLTYLFSSAKQLKPKTDVEILTEYLESKGSGVPMYYAEP